MAFLNIDKLLVSKFIEKFSALKEDPDFAVNDTFEDLPEEEIQNVLLFLSRKEFTEETRDREGSKVYVMPNFPLSEVPFPQIAVSLGSESPDRFLGDMVDVESTHVLNDAGDIIGYDTTKGYMSKVNLTIHCVCSSKNEAIWLTRLCQRFISESFTEFSSMGVHEIGMTLQDLVADEGTMQPSTIFNRAIQFTATVENTWKKRTLITGTYDTGVNLALEDL